MKLNILHEADFETRSKERRQRSEGDPESQNRAVTAQVRAGKHPPGALTKPWLLLQSQAENGDRKAQRKLYNQFLEDDDALTTPIAWIQHMPSGKHMLLGANRGAQKIIVGRRHLNKGDIVLVTTPNGHELIDIDGSYINKDGKYSGHSIDAQARYGSLKIVNSSDPLVVNVQRGRKALGL